jgi:hypothetical protein
MKAFLRIAALLALLLLVSATLFLSSGKQTGLVFQTNAAGAPTGIIFDYDFSQPANRACSATITTNCVSGFSFTMQLNNASFGAPVQNILLPATINAAGPTLGITCSNCIPALTNLGNYTLCVQTNYRDVNGIGQAGNSACLTYSIPSVAVNLRTQ